MLNGMEQDTIDCLEHPSDEYNSREEGGVADEG